MDQLDAPASGGLFHSRRRPSFFGRKTATSSSSSTIGQPQRTTTPPQLPHASAVCDSPPKAPQNPQTPPRRKHSARHSISSSVAEIGTTLRRSRSASLKTNTSSGTASSHTRAPSAATLALSLSPEKPGAAPAQPASLRPALSISTFTRSKQKGADHAAKPADTGSAVDNQRTPFGSSSSMAVPIPLRYPPTDKEVQQAQRQASGSYGSKFSNSSLAPAAPIPMPNGASANIVFQQIHELASKRISTLDYLRKAHEGRIYWFNTLLFEKKDLTRLPSFLPRNMARRATNYLLLGSSLPTILDLNSNSPQDYLKALNALLLEFEQYQTIHPPDGSTPSSLSRGRMAQVFKRPNLMGGKGRRSSSAAGDLPLLTSQGSFNESSLESAPDDVLLPNESYTHLQTPHIPFDPDFFSTFATLCDVLIDCYTKILSMLSTAESVAIAGGGVPSVIGDLFSKADARIRKIILAGVVREFEDSCRQGARAEIGGVGKVVLGGLM